MAKWSALVTPLLDWPPAGHARSIENARSSATEACQRRVEREEVAAYPLSPKIRIHWLESGDHDFRPAKGSAVTAKGNLLDAAGAVAEWINGIVS